MMRVDKVESPHLPMQGVRMTSETSGLVVKMDKRYLRR